MLLTTVIIILREVLEAALLLSILLALARVLGMRPRWLYPAMVLGLLGAVTYGLTMSAVSNAFEGVGQEVANATMQLGIYVCVLFLSHLFIRQYLAKTRPSPWLITTMRLAVVLAVVREGSEIFIYLSGARQLPDALQSVVIGALIGAGIGFGVGALFYYLLLGVQRRNAVWLGGALLTLVGAGMCLQSTQLLIQADWLPAQYPLWDSSALIPEESVAGQLPYALVGYESRPTPLQLAIYLSSLGLMTLQLYLTYLYCRKQGHSS